MKASLPVCFCSVAAFSRWCGAFALATWVGGNAVAAQVLPYSLRSRQVQGRTRVQVYQTDTGSLVWTRSLGFISHVTWSPVHRAVALSDEDSVKGTDIPFSVLAWRIGHSPLVFRGWWPGIASPKLRRDFASPWHGSDYVEGMAWSPRRDSLLVWTGGSGMGDLNTSFLFCLDLNRRKTYYLGNAFAGNAFAKFKPGWIRPRAVKFWTYGPGPVYGPNGHIEGYIYTPSSRPTFWHMP